MQDGEWKHFKTIYITGPNENPIYTRNLRTRPEINSLKAKN